MTPSTLRTTLGLPHYGIEQLCCLGTLERETDEAIVYLRRTWSLTSGSVAECNDAIVRRATSGKPVSGTARIGTAARRIGGRLKPWAPLLIAMMSGDLQFWLLPDRRSRDWPLLRRAMVRRSDLMKLEHLTFCRTDYPLFPFSPTMSLTDARDMLNLGGAPTHSLASVLGEDRPTAASVSSTQPKPNCLESRVGLSVASVLAASNRLISCGEISERTG